MLKVMTMRMILMMIMRIEEVVEEVVPVVASVDILLKEEKVADGSAILLVMLVLPHSHMEDKDVADLTTMMTMIEEDVAEEAALVAVVLLLVLLAQEKEGVTVAADGLAILLAMPVQVVIVMIMCNFLQIK